MSLFSVKKKSVVLTAVLLWVFVASGHSQTVKFLGEDRATQGDWKNVYGTEGYNLAYIGASNPAYATLSILAPFAWQWQAATTDVRAPQRIVENYRTAGSWTSVTSTTFDLATLSFSDTGVHRVSVYCLGWEYAERAQTLEIRDAVTDALLDSRNITQFINGVYYRWNVSGNVKIRIITTAVSAAVSGIFFDPPTSDPAWWSTGNPPVIDPLAPVNNQGPANIGQAKWMAKGALDALRTRLPAVANAIEADLVGPGKPIANWNAPATPAEQELQRAPLLIGQLKAISAPFYIHLKTADAAWLTSQKTLNGTLVAGSDFPWTAATTDDSNKAMATIGQLKAVFSLRFESLFGGPDTDEDGLPDSWEMAYFGNVLQNEWDDYDGDGLTNLEEYQLGTNPALFDSDGDGVPDGEDSNPLSADYQPVTATAVRVLTPLK